MMGPRTLRWYIVRKFLMGILGTFALCSILIFMIDFVELLRQAGKFGGTSASRLVWMTLLRLPAYTEILLSFAVLVGTIGALLMLNRKSELAVMRSAGMSAWQFLAPGLAVGLALGIFAVLVFNPIAAKSRTEAERLFAETFGREANFLRRQSGGNWLRQDGPDGPTVFTAGAVSNKGLTLTAMSVFQFDAQGRFIERIDAATANLRDGHWQLDNALVTRVGREPEQFASYIVSTYLTPERVKDALGTVISISVFDLPGMIEVAEKAGLSSALYKVQYELLLSRPALLMAMVLLGATVSLRSFRSGRIQTMVVTGMLGGLGFFLLAEVSRQIGVAALVAPWTAVWVPVATSTLVSLTVLLHQEDG
jgi:lipopolysaccharide export system permease protein